MPESTRRAAMIKRTVEISRQSVHVSVRHRQLLLWPHASDGQPPLAEIPCEDIGLLLVDEPTTTFTHAALAALIDADAAVVLCGRDHLPAGMLVPFSSHTQVVHRLKAQLALRPPLRKQLWRQIVIAKIRAQAANLLEGSAGRTRLLALARGVRSGDPTNVESQAARTYWACLFTQGAFRRDPDEAGRNALLNYGYAVVRAAVARAIVAAGLLPALGLQHSNRSNAFCLADDLVEPLRPMVDERVRDMAAEGLDDITPESKRPLLELLTREVTCGGQSGPLMVALHRYAASLAQCYAGERKTLEIPVRTDDGESDAEPLSDADQ